MKITCPHCKSAQVRSIDNQTIFHPTKADVDKGTPNIDNEIYMEIQCDECTKTFTQSFEIVPENTVKLLQLAYDEFVNCGIELEFMDTIKKQLDLING